MALRPHKKDTTFRGLFIDVKENGLAVDLTGVTIVAYFKHDSCNGLATQYTIGNGIEVTDAVNGEFAMFENMLIDWKVGTWTFEVVFTFPDGRKEVYYEDTIKITGSIR